MIILHRKILATTNGVNCQGRGATHSNVPDCPLAEDIEYLISKGFLESKKDGIWITEEGKQALAMVEEDDDGPTEDDMNDGLGPLPMGMR